MTFPRVALLVDGAPGAVHRDVTLAGLEHAIVSQGAAIQVEVVPTGSLSDRLITDFAGVFVGPGSPYDDPETVIDWIREARERGVPLVGT